MVCAMSHGFCMSVGVCQESLDVCKESDMVLVRGEQPDRRKSVSWHLDDKGNDITTVQTFEPVDCSHMKENTKTIGPKRPCCCSIVLKAWRAASLQAKKGVCNCLSRLWRRFHAYSHDYQEIE